MIGTAALRIILFESIKQTTTKLLWKINKSDITNYTQSTQVC
jgi:hypothetical protein